MDAIAPSTSPWTEGEAKDLASNSVASYNRRLAELWLDALAAEHGASSGTLATYKDDLTCYLAFLAQQSVAFADVTVEHIRAYLAELTASGYAEATLAHRRSVVRGLHRFLVAEKLSPCDPTRDLAPMKRSSPLPYTPTIEEVDQLLETAHTQASDASVGLYRQAGYARRAALLEVLYASGMRVSEAVHLPSCAIRPGARAITILGKGGKERLVPLHDRAVQAVSLWRRLAQKHGTASHQWLFHAVKDGSRPLTRQAALLEIKETARTAGLRHPDRISPHKLRHAFATHMLSNGADLRVIQELLGHADLGSTEIYTHVDVARARAMVRDLHPLNKRDE